MGVIFDAMIEALETPEAAKILTLKVREAVSRYVTTMPQVNNPNNVEDYGGCPECHENHGFLYKSNGDLFYICKTHRNAWNIGGGSPILMTDDEFLAEETVLNFGFTRIDKPWRPYEVQTESQGLDNDLPF